MDFIASQAKYYNNIPLVSPKYRSVIHLEDEEDKVFWDPLLQRFRPGQYFYVSFSKSEQGNDTHGCDQCLKYLPFLTDRFFLCLDSDFRYLMGEPDINSDHFVLQTYTYSWENHFCQSDSLQASVVANTEGCLFDFSVFLQKLSQVLYEPLLLLLYCKRIGNTCLTEATFRRILRTQCTAIEAQSNGQVYVDSLAGQFEPFLANSGTIGFDADAERKIYGAKGLDKENAYLHVRGHNLYDLVVYIGKMYVHHQGFSFGRDVMKNVLVDGDYWELAEIEKDIKSIG